MSLPIILGLLPSLPSTKQLDAGDFNLDELVKRLSEALVNDSQWNEILQLTGDSAVLVMECLDKVSEFGSRSRSRVLITLQAISSDAFRTNLDLHARSKLLSMTSRLSRRIQYLPRSYWTDPKAVTLSDEPYASGTCAEVYRGAQGSEHVAVKVLRTSNQENPVELMKVSTGGGQEARHVGTVDLVGDSVFVKRRSCGNTCRVRTSSSSTAYSTTMAYRR